MREIQREREKERERERERERDESDVTLVALKLAMNFAPFLAKTLQLAMKFCTFRCQKCPPYYWRRVLHVSLPKMCTLISSLLLKGAEFTISVAKNVALFETVRVLRFASVKWRDRGSKHRNKRSNFCPHRPSSHRKNESN